MIGVANPPGDAACPACWPFRTVCWPLGGPVRVGGEACRCAGAAGSEPGVRLARLGGRFRP